MIQEYWVVGGNYRDSSFVELSDGGGELHGPFATYDEAFTAWRDRANRTRAQATARYSVVVTASKR